MCTSKLVTERFPDGHKEKSYRFEMCNEARLGLPCLETSASSRTRSSNQTYYHTDSYLPPTPSYTPVSSTPVYRSGDESDRSYHSSSSNGRRRASRIYVGDNQYLDPRSYRPAKRDGPRAASERVVIVDGPPTPRTPPQTYTFPHSAPSSPNFGTSVPYVPDASPRMRESTRRRPVIVDERPRPRVQIVEPSPERKPKTHSRNGSSDSAARAAASAATRDQELLERQREEIARQNAEINSRPSVPVSRPLKRSATYNRPGAPSFEADLTEPFARMDLSREQRREERARRQAEQAQQAEQEALDRRLRERLMPRRRATVGPGTRRHPILYDDGLYRWE